MDKATFIANIQQKIDQLNGKLEDMRHKAERDQMYHDIARERDDLQRDVDTLTNRIDERWEDVKDRIEDGWNNLNNKFDDSIR